MRINLATDITTRDGSLDKDAKILNGFVDVDVVKRPAVNSVLATASGQAQGMINNNSLVYMINGDVMRSYNSAFTLVQTVNL